MTDLFLILVNRSITASWLVAAVILLRFLLRKAPKALHCLLWGMVAIRLICPFSPESPFSLVPDQAPITPETFQSEPVVPSPQIEHGFVAYEAPSGEITFSETVMVNHTGGPFPVLYWLTGIWLAGMVLLLVWAAESYLNIRKQAAPSIFMGDDVWICDHIDTPFILGLIRPRIYLPSGLNDGDASHVLAHERAHLKRKDHWWKPLGFLLLCIHWLNPAMWLAYLLLCRDIELACDEKVVKSMDAAEKKAYSTALLNCSLPRHRIAACPLAFGEVGVKQRVKNVLYYKKPAFWVILISAVLCIIAAVCLLTNPVSKMYLYEIDDSRNYSDLFANADEIYLIKEGEEYPAAHPDGVLNLLDDITVRKYPVSRSREETRDKTHRIHLHGNTYLNFSWNFTHVWIDNGVKPTYTYRVHEPEVLRELFAIITGEKLSMTVLDVTPTGLTAVYSPKKIYDSDDILLEPGHLFLEVWQENQWKRMDAQSPINITISAKETERHQLNWFHVYGPLPAGKYRLGSTVIFGDIHMSSGIAHDLYAEFSISKHASVWFSDSQDAAHSSPMEDSTVQLPGAEQITLHHSYQDHEITMAAGGDAEVIITGWPILNAFFYDLTGDGVDEVCTTVAEGFGLIDIRIRVYDCMEKRLYELVDRGNYDYILSVRSNCLTVTRTNSDQKNIQSTGLLSLIPNSTTLTVLPLDDSAG